MKVAILAVLAVLIVGAVQARADSSDDLTVCCVRAENPPRIMAQIALANARISEAEGCSPIDGSPASINQCQGLVLGCAESPFMCQPSASGRGWDCLCEFSIPLGMPK